MHQLCKRFHVYSRVVRVLLLGHVRWPLVVGESITLAWKALPTIADMVSVWLCHAWCMFEVQEERGIYTHMPSKDTTSKDCGLAACVAKDFVAITL